MTSGEANAAIGAVGMAAGALGACVSSGATAATAGLLTGRPVKFTCGAGAVSAVAISGVVVSAASFAAGAGR